MTNTPQTNNQPLDDFMTKSRELGRALAAGGDALPMFACAVAEAASKGILSDVKDAEGNDDVARAYIELVKAASKKAIHEHTKGGLKANISKARQIKHASEKPTCDFYGETMPKVIAKRAEMTKAGEKVKAAFAAYVDAARAQTEQDDDLTDDQIASVIRKPEPADKTIEKELGAIVKKMEDLISGEKGVKYDDQDFVDAFEKVQSCEAALQLKVRKDKARQEAIALGLISEDADADAEMELAA